MGNRWGNSGNSVRLYFWGLKITADGDCSHEIKRCLLLGRKVMTNLDSILKSRDITLPTKVHLVKAMVFPVVMYGYDMCTPMFIAALFIIARIWKQPRCPSADEWKKAVVHIHNGVLLSH